MLTGDRVMYVYGMACATDLAMSPAHENGYLPPRFGVSGSFRTLATHRIMGQLVGTFFGKSQRIVSRTIRDRNGIDNTGLQGAQNTRLCGLRGAIRPRQTLVVFPINPNESEGRMDL